MIIGLSGKKQHGKDTVAKIIQYLIARKEDKRDIKIKTAEFLGLTEANWINVISQSCFTTKSFADKLKDIVCLLINCTREQLEDNNFKEKELGEEWRVWYVENSFKIEFLYGIVYDCKKDCDDSIILGQKEGGWGKNIRSTSRILTPRLLLQFLGTECGRHIIHPNIWVNSLMSDYTKSLTGLDAANHFVKSDGTSIELNYPNWIITDVRFPNEAEAVKSKEGLLIRVNRSGMVSNDYHPSETSLDYYPFEEVINNDKDIAYLIKQVKNILLKYKII